MTDIQITTLTAKAADGSTFTANRGPLGLHDREGWSVDGPTMLRGWPSVVGIDVDHAKRLLADCVESYDRWHAATTAANEALEERNEAIREYFRGVVKK